MNAYSTLHNYRQEIQSPNYQLIATALQFKQGRIDAGRNKLQSITDQLAVLDIVKDEDKEYAEKRLSSAVDIVDKYSAGDLSNSSYVRELTGKLSEVVDDNVMTAITSTSLFRAEQKEWQKHEGTDKYSEDNHAFAMQNANKWMSDGQVGKAYKGGGGFIEFQDLSKKILDNLPDLQKALKAEWISTGPKEGYFRSILTQEAVSRSDMNGALNFLFDGKDNKQMQINAWTQYGSLEPDDVKAAYNEYYQPRLDEAQQRIKDIDLAIGKTTDPSKKAEYTAERGQWESQLESLSNNSFDKVAEAYGVEAAYSTLYKSQFKDDILDTYSYAPRVIKKEIDAVSKENQSHQLKLDQFAETQRTNLEKEAVARARLGIDMAKAGLAGGAGAVGPFSQVSGGAGDEIVQPTDPKLSLEKKYEIRDQAVSAMDEVLKSKGLSPDLKTSPEFIKQMSNRAGKQFITLKDENGIDQTIDIAENFDLLDNYEKEMMTTSPEEKQAFRYIEGMLNKVEEELRIGANLNSESNIYGDRKIDLFKELPKFNFRLVEDKHGKLKYKYLDNDKETHLYAHLIKNGVETRAGKETLKLYKALHLMNDPNLEPTDKRQVKDYVNNILSENPQLAKNIKTDIVTSGRMKNTHSNISMIDDFWLTEFKKSDVKPSSVEETETSSGPFVTVSTRIPDSKREDFGKMDPNLKGESRRADMVKRIGSLQGPDEIIYKGFTDIATSQTAAFAMSQDAMPRHKPQVIHFGSPQYNILRDELGIPDPNHKMTITMKQELDATSGEMTGNVIVSTMMKNTDKDTKDAQPYVSMPPKSVPKSLLESKGVAVFKDDVKSRYDATKPLAARSLNLGNNIYDDSKVRLTFKPPPNAPNTRVRLTDEILDSYVSLTKEELGEEAASMVAAEIKRFEDGEFQFSAEPVDGSYYMSVKRGDQKPFLSPIFQQDEGGSPMPTSELTPYMRKNLIKDPRVRIEEAFAGYLNNFISETLKPNLRNR